VTVPGSGAEIILLRSRRATVEALRSDQIRDLRTVGARHAVAGATLQHEGGLLRHPPAHSRIRQMINPLFSLPEAERMRPAIRALATTRAASLRMGLCPRRPGRRPLLQATGGWARADRPPPRIDAGARRAASADESVSSVLTCVRPSRARRLTGLPTLLHATPSWELHNLKVADVDTIARHQARLRIRDPSC
jgi:hypothetical protein